MILRYIIFGLLVFSPLCALAKDSSDTISIKVRETALRSKPKAWASGISQLKYGDKLSVLGTEDGWFKVKATSGKEGYLHPSVVSSRPVVLRNDKTNSNRNVDPSDVVLAGKGFSKEIEKQYALQNPSLKFNELNRIEQLRISGGEIQEFMRQGMLAKGRL